MTAQPLARITFLTLFFTISFILACKKGDNNNQQNNTPNLPPASFEISITDLKYTSASLTWTEAKDPEGKPVTYAFVIGADTFYRNTERKMDLYNLTENKKYEVTVIASDPEGAKTKNTTSFTTIEPSAPSVFEITLTKVGGSIAAAKWTASRLPDSTPVKYDVYLNDNLLKENLADTVLHYEFSKLKELTQYTVKVIAKSKYNKTQQSVKSFTTAQDPAPTGLTTQVKLVSYSLLKFSFAPATDAEGQAITYTVLLDNTDVTAQLGTALKPGIDYTLRSLTPEKTYKLTIKATDEGGKLVSTENTLVTLKQPTLVITNKSVTKTADGFIYNLETNVDYKPSRIDLYANGALIASQPTVSSIIGGNTISYTYPNSYLTTDGNISLTANLFWGDDTEKSRTATSNSFTYYNFKPTSVAVSEAKIDNGTYKTYLIFFQNSTISPYSGYSIVEVVFGTTNVPFSIFRTGDVTGYLTEFVTAQLAVINAGPRTGYVIMKDNAGYHQLNFTWSYY
jgi:hypothetical protein